MLKWMFYYRGHSGDFDEWEALGNPGWGWKGVEPYFKRAEKFIGQGNDANIYGTESKMGVEQNRFRYQADDIVLRALKERGYKLGEVNGAEEDEGFWARAVQSTTLGWRAGTYNSFVRPLLDEKDIKVLTYTLAKEVVFDEKDKLKAKGIKVERFGEELEYNAKKEVILSAGAIGSAQILMLSGIGPKAELAKNGIQSRIDLPVGKNLQDHIHLPFQFHVGSDEDLTLSPFMAMNPVNIFNYVVNGSGPLAYNNLGANGAWHSPLAKGEKRPGTDSLFSCFSDCLIFYCA